MLFLVTGPFLDNSTSYQLSSLQKQTKQRQGEELSMPTVYDVGGCVAVKTHTTRVISNVVSSTGRCLSMYVNLLTASYLVVSWIKNKSSSLIFQFFPII